MAIVSSSLKIDLGDGKALYVVREDRSPEVIMSLVEQDQETVKKRTTITLQIGQAMQLARALAGLTTIDDIV